MPGLEDRIKERLYASRKKRWYQRGWGRVLIAGSAVIVAYLLVFTAQVVVDYREILEGKVTPEEFVQNFKQDAKIDLLHNSNDPSIGPVEAPVTIVAFEDFECPFCHAAQPFIKKMIVRYGPDIRFIYKDFPLRTIHPNAQEAAEAAQCAFEQGKFWEFHDELFAHQDLLAEAYYRTVASKLGLNLSQFNACFKTGKYRQQIAEDVQLGSLLGVQGTPTFFVNGEYFVAGYTTEVDQLFDKAIEFIKQL
ncbi:MAG: DsbA family protein [Candidatus Komeilibacteria bacterium]|nr:DsbA family protein [Candidatus Komeilibacteria bacterium]